MGDKVEIVVGSHADRIGEVVHVWRGTRGQVYDVRFEVPVMLTRPDGPMETITFTFAASELAVQPKHRLVHPSGVAFVQVRPLPHGFRPKHCAGGNTCLHLHPGDDPCACGQVTLPAEVGHRTLTLQPATLGGDAPPKPVRHTRGGCHAIAPAVPA